LTSFGAFTKLEEGIDGLIHISEIADRRIERPEEVVTVGDEIDVKVINLDPKGRRIGLSLKAAVADQERAAAPPEERQERPRRQRPAPRREHREAKPVEEETIMGTLLKQEMGKNNIENQTSFQETETPEISEVAENTQVSEDTENTEVSKDAENGSPDASEDTQATENVETSEDIEISENVETSEDVEVSEDTDNPEVSEDTGDSNNSEVPENSES
jgi:4-hydroxy-3-methylbut-2-enyl diphosphate reductase